MWINKKNDHTRRLRTIFTTITVISLLLMMQVLNFVPIKHPKLTRHRADVITHNVGWTSGRNKLLSGISDLCYDRNMLFCLFFLRCNSLLFLCIHHPGNQRYTRRNRRTSLSYWNPRRCSECHRGMNQLPQYTRTVTRLSGLLIQSCTSCLLDQNYIGN